VIIAVGTTSSGNTSDPPPTPPVGQTTAVFTQASTNLRATLSISPGDSQKLDFTADPGFLGTAIFEYTIDEDPNDNDVSTGASTRFVTVQVVNGVLGGVAGLNGTAQVLSTTADLAAAHYLAELDTSVVMADASGNPTDTITKVHQFETFYLRVQAKDLRPIPSGGIATDRGVQAAFLDMLLNPGDTGLPFRNFAQPDPNDSSNPMSAIVTATQNGFASETRTGQNGVSGAQSAAEFNEAGDFRQSANGLGTGLVSVFYVKMKALTPTPLLFGGGRANLVVAGDPAEGAANNVVLMPQDRNSLDPLAQIPVQATDDQVFMRPIAFPILMQGEAEFTNIVNPRDVDVDGDVTAGDVITVINSINANGSRSLLGLTPSSNSAFIDVNMDNNVTSMDVLTIINYINALTVKYHAASTTSTGGSTSLDASLTPLSAPSGVQSSSTITTTPTLLTSGSTSSTSSSTSTPTSTSSSSSTTTSSSTSSSTVDPAAADDLYASMDASKQTLLKRFGR
jgi:hypothetical protein